MEHDEIPRARECAFAGLPDLRQIPRGSLFKGLRPASRTPGELTLTASRLTPLPAGTAAGVCNETAKVCRSVLIHLSHDKERSLLIPSPPLRGMLIPNDVGLRPRGDAEGSASITTRLPAFVIRTLKPGASKEASVSEGRNARTGRWAGGDLVGGGG
jgi:hypothetical protein